MLSDATGIATAVGAPFIDVVPGVKDEVELFLGDTAEAREVPRLVMIAAADRKPQLTGRGAGRRRRPGPPSLAHFVARSEAVPVLSARVETGHLDVHAVAELRTCDLGAFLRHGPEAVVGRDLPLDFDVGHRHAA